MTVRIDVVSVERKLFSGMAEMVMVPGEIGELGIMPGHAPLMTRIIPGVVRIKRPNQEEHETIYVNGGILEVQPHLVSILADTALRASDIDEARALKVKQEAEEAIRNYSSNIDYAKVRIELQQAIAKLQTIHYMKEK